MVNLGLPVQRLNDTTVSPECGAGVIIQSGTTVLVNNLPVALEGDMVIYPTCVGFLIQSTQKTFQLNKKVIRLTDMDTVQGVVVTQSPNVLSG